MLSSRLEKIAIPLKGEHKGQFRDIRVRWNEASTFISNTVMKDLGI